MRSRVLPASLAALAVGALVGLVVAGGGSRLAMRLVALADDQEDFGFVTGSGAFVGEITVAGTIAVLGTGIVLGIVGAFLYLALRRWLPARPSHRGALFAVIVVGLGLVLTIEFNQGDFDFAAPATTVLSFAAVLLLYAVVVPPLVERLAPRSSGHSRWGRALVGTVLAVALIGGAFAVKHAFEFAAGSRLSA